MPLWKITHWHIWQQCLTRIYLLTYFSFHELGQGTIPTNIHLYAWNNHLYSGILLTLYGLNQDLAGWFITFTCSWNKAAEPTVLGLCDACIRTVTSYRYGIVIEKLALCMLIDYLLKTLKAKLSYFHLFSICIQKLNCAVVILLCLIGGSYIYAASALCNS